MGKVSAEKKKNKIRKGSGAGGGNQTGSLMVSRKQQTRKGKKNL